MSEAAAVGQVEDWELDAPAHPWSPALRVAFRFVCCYWVLYAMPESGRVSVFGAIPGSTFVTRYYQQMWHAIVPWVATHVFHVTGHAATYFLTGSGDTTLQYVHNLLYLVVALAGALIWSALDRRRSPIVEAVDPNEFFLTPGQPNQAHLAGQARLVNAIVLVAGKIA